MGNNQKIMEVELGSISDGSFKDYKIILNDYKEIKADKNLPPKIKVILFMILFAFIGPLLTLFLHKNAFKFFYKYIREEYLHLRTYIHLNNNLMCRLTLFIISILISFNTPLLILYKTIENRYDNSYDWSGLYHSLKKEGYNPDKYKDGYITITKLKGVYTCIDGNHRRALLEYIYGKNYKIKVKYGGTVYKPNNYPKCL